MPRKHRGRHAQPMGANIKGKPGQLACLLPPSIAGEKATDIEAIPQRQRCSHSVKLVSKTNRSLTMTGELIMHRALFKLLKKYSIAANLLQQAVTVPQVAERQSAV